MVWTERSAHGGDNRRLPLWKSTSSLRMSLRARTGPEVDGPPFCSCPGTAGDALARGSRRFRRISECGRAANDRALSNRIP